MSFFTLTLLLCFLLFGLGTISQAATYTVTSTADTDGTTCGTTCTLRQAINAANSNAGSDTINFAIASSGVQTITVASVLPTITGTNGAGTVINGYTQAGSDNNTSLTSTNAILKIELRGATTFDGLVINTNGCTVRGLSITGFRYGVYLNTANATGNTVSGNYIGFRADGTFSSNVRGVYINSGPANTIGGSTLGDRNVIGGDASINGRGIYVFNSAATGNKISGNFVGLYPNGTASVAGASCIGIINAPNTIVGGTTAAERNVIAGSQNVGIDLNGSTAKSTRITGNYIGTSASGNAALPNNAGIIITDVANTIIGGTTAAERNVISGNNYAFISLGTVTGSTLTGNYVGVAADGTTALGNNSGVGVDSTTGLSIGGTSAGQGNLISNNAAFGVYIDGTSANIRVRGNSIYANGNTPSSLGIDLGEANPDGVTPNDAGDGDTGPNNLQNYPVLSSATSSGGSTVIKGTLNSTANTTFTLDFYSSPIVDASGYGEGQTYLGSTTVTTPASGNDVSFTATLSGVSVADGASITATATDSGGNTSEFSQGLTNNLSVSTGGAIISQFRFGGPGGTSDEFIELANTTGSPLNLSGWTINASTTTTALAAINFAARTIPAYGRLLLTNSGGYSLGSYAMGDLSYTGDIALNSTLTLSNASGTPIDVVGDLSSTAPTGATSNYAYLRRLDKASPADTNVDANDFSLVDINSINSTTGASGIATLLTGPRLGAPGPRNTLSPIQRNTQVKLVPTTDILSDAKYPTANTYLDPNGRLTLRRKFTNNTGTSVSTVRFRITAITAGTSTDSDVSDIRALTSGGGTGNGVRLEGLSLDAPSVPTQSSKTFYTTPPTAGSGNGGGLNSSLTLAIPGGSLANGASVNVEFNFGIIKDGKYRIVVDAELLP